MENALVALRQNHGVDAPVEPDPVACCHGQVNIDNNIRIASHSRDDSDTWMPSSEVDVPPMARALEPCREKSPTQDTVNQSLVGTMTTDFVRAKLRHCVPTQKIEPNPRDAVALGRPDEVCTRLVAYHFKSPFGINLDLVKDFLN